MKWVENNFTSDIFQIHSLKSSLNKFQRISKALASHHSEIRSSFSDKKREGEPVSSCPTQQLEAWEEWKGDTVEIKCENIE